MPDVKKPLRSLAVEFGVDLDGLTDDQFNELAIRFVVDGRLNSEVFAALVEDVRRGGGGGSVAEATAPSASPPPLHPYRFNATEATEAKYRARLALAHRAEDGRTGLRIVPKTREMLPVMKPHPACLAAARDGSEPCFRCRWLLIDDPYTEFWLDRDD